MAKLRGEPDPWGTLHLLCIGDMFKPRFFTPRRILDAVTNSSTQALIPSAVSSAGVDGWRSDGDPRRRV